MAKNQVGFFINQQRCVGCQACEIACKQENEVEIGARWRRVLDITGEDKNGPYLNFLSIACNHCANPACVPVCPVDAITKDEKSGIVFPNSDKCIGCKSCLKACPYNAPQFAEPKKGEKIAKMQKCDYCAHRIINGKKPSCVASCPIGALDADTIDRLKKKYGKVNNTEGFTAPKYTKPAVVFKLPLNKQDA